MNTPASPRPGLREVGPYDSPQLEVAARLNTNECPLPLPVGFSDDLAAAVRELPLNRYPDGQMRALREALADAHGTRGRRRVDRERLERDPDAAPAWRTAVPAGARRSSSRPTCCIGGSAGSRRRRSSNVAWIRPSRSTDDAVAWAAGVGRRRRVRLLAEQSDRQHPAARRDPVAGGGIGTGS